MRFRPQLSMLALSLLMLPFTSCTDDPSLTSIVISPSSYTATLAFLPNGQVAPTSEQLWTQYTATGYYTHPGHEPITKDLTNQVTWLSYTPLLVTINSSGVATVAGTAIGFTQIAASMPGFHGDVVSNDSTFTVQLPSSVTTTDVVDLAVSPQAPIVGPGNTEGFVAVGTTGTGATESLTNLVTWTSSNPSVATIGAKTGLATAVAVGNSEIVATYTNSDGFTVTATSELIVQTP